VAVEPMAEMHYVTMSTLHRSCRIEIGYYQPADVWHSVAMSNKTMVPSAETSETENLDLVTIPFHLSFQQLVNLFGAASDNALATMMSRFQTRALSSEGHRELSPEERKIFRRGEVATARSRFRIASSNRP
jgi:hypothetical protein